MWAERHRCARCFGRFGCLPLRHRAKFFVFSSCGLVTSVALCVLSVLSVDLSLTEDLPWSAGSGVFSQSCITGRYAFKIGLRGFKRDLTLGWSTNDTSCQDLKQILLWPPADEPDLVCPGTIAHVSEMKESKGGFQIGIGTTSVQVCTITGSDMSKVVSNHNNSLTKVFEWADDKCKTHFQNTSTVCDDCKSACWTAFTCVVSSLLFLPMCIYSDFHRSRESTDSNCEKFMGAAGNIIGGFWTLASLQSFTNNCVDGLGDVHAQAHDEVYASTEAGNISTSWTSEVGYYALIAATILLMVDGFIHLLMPTPSCCWMLVEEISMKEIGQRDDEGMPLSKNAVGPNNYEAIAS